MLTAIKPYLFPVVDQETYGVVCFAPTHTVANAVSQGILNTSPMTIYWPRRGNSAQPDEGYNDRNDLNSTLVFKLPPKAVSSGYVTSDCNVAQAVSHTASGRPFDFVPMEPGAITEQWRAKRSLANDRVDALDQLERRCEKYLLRTGHFISDPLFLAYIGHELALCRPLEGHYTALFADWGSINDVSAAAAYNELNMTWHSAGIATVKLHALWTKYVRLINQQHSGEAMENCVKVQFEGEIRFGKRP
jgi:hypothetical protein